MAEDLFSDSTITEGKGKDCFRGAVSGASSKSLLCLVQNFYEVYVLVDKQ